MVFIQAALNGDRKHPAVPRTADQIAQDAKAAVDAGARSVHIHAFDDAGAETLDSDACAKALRATRRKCPGIPISLTTSAAIVSDPALRLRIISSWAGRRVLIEPLDADPDEAVLRAAEMEDIVIAAGITLEQIHHGYGIASWAVNQRAITRGRGIRTGLEDTAVLPDGREAESNAQLVKAAVLMIGSAHLR